jgi:hypothetical protein
VGLAALSRRMLQQMDGVKPMAITVQLVYLGTAVAFAGSAAVHHLLTREIPNWITGHGPQ